MQASVRFAYLGIYFSSSHTISSWIEDTSIVTNENGIYIDPTGKNGTKIGDDENNVEIVNPMEEIDNSNKDTNSNTKKTDEVKTEWHKQS